MFNYNEIEEFKRPYIIAEIGANHNGNMELAKEMIRKAKDCGADCAKFQSWSVDSLCSENLYKKNEMLKKEIEEYSIDCNEHYSIKNYCDEIGIDFNSTPFSKEEVDLLVDELKVPFIKVASMDLNNTPFLSYVAKKGKPVVLSTGFGDLSDINDAIKCLKGNGCNEIILLHCVSIYPPEPELINLRNIEMLRDVFNCKVGFSDHSIGTIAPILSMGKGACIIEKHFTLDKNMQGWDHKVSANPEELKIICDSAQIAYKMLGTYQRVVNESLETKNAFRRSIVAARNILKGEIIKEEDIMYKRPGTGIEPKYYNMIIGKVAKRDIEKDRIIEIQDF